MIRFVIFVIAFRTLDAGVEASVIPQDLPEMPDNFPFMEGFNMTDLSIALQQDHPDTMLTTIEMINKYGYHYEKHTIPTKDDYFLELHRITGLKASPSPVGKPPVLVVHGILSSSVDWVIAGPGKGLGYLLADAGYDVWLGNVRGNVYSRSHKKLTTRQKAFWKFTWHEIGHHDLPSMVDYILEKTNRQKLFYVGHSQGTTSFFVMASEHPEYNDKVEAMFALAPIAFCSRMNSPVLQILARLTKMIAFLMEILGEYEFRPNDKFFNMVKSKICSENSWTQPICSNVLFLLAGFSPAQMNMTLLPAIINHIPAGASVLQFVHYAQSIKSGYFRRYDHGLLGNWKEYRKIKPPEYNLKLITAPVSLHYSTNDWLANTKDVQKLYSQLPNPIGQFQVPDKLFNHLDFLWGIDAKTLLYDEIIDLMSRYNGAKR